MPASLHSQPVLMNERQGMGACSWYAGCGRSPCKWWVTASHLVHGPVVIRMGRRSHTGGTCTAQPMWQSADMSTTLAARGSQIHPLLCIWTYLTAPAGYCTSVGWGAANLKAGLHACLRMSRTRTSWKSVPPYPGQRLHRAATVSSSTMHRA